MNSPQKSADILSRVDFVKLAETTFRGIWTLLKTLGESILLGSFPWLILAATVSNLLWLIYFEFDLRVLRIFKLAWIRPKASSPLFPYYCLTVALLALMAWAAGVVSKKRKLTHELRPALLEADLQNKLGKFPEIVKLWPISESSLKLRVTNANLSLDRFKSKQRELEAALGVYIDEISENRSLGTIDILFAVNPLPRLVPFLEVAENLPPNTIVVGKTHARVIRETFDKIAHLLIGGETIGGKSTFLRSLVASLYLNNKDAKFIFIDLKGGTEGNPFGGIDRIEVFEDTKSSAAALSRLIPLHKRRLELFKMNSCVDLASFLKIPKESRKQHPEISSRDPMGRYYVIIDEAQILFLAGPNNPAEDVQAVRSATNLLTQQGRATGIHFIIATQRPDVKTVDAQTKANLVGQLAFATSNLASSMTILGNGRAVDIPKDAKGRAIWKLGGEMQEVQTPFISSDDVTKLLKERSKADRPFKEGPPSITTLDQSELEDAHQIMGSKE